jgi:hypothetical protein
MLFSARSASQRVAYELVGDAGLSAIGVLMLSVTAGGGIAEVRYLTTYADLGPRPRSLGGALAGIELSLQTGSVEVPGAQRFETLDDGDPGYARLGLLAATFAEILRPFLAHSHPHLN